MMAFDNMTNAEMIAFARERNSAVVDAARELQRQMPELSLSQALRVVEQMIERDGATV